MGGNKVFKRKKYGNDNVEKFLFINKKNFEKNNKERKIPNRKPISEKILRNLYLNENKSMFEISLILKTSLHKVDYWMTKYSIPVRNQSDATYVKRNPNGDPFIISKPKTIDDALLFGLGLGLYWGEGNKLNKNSIRLGNTDPELIKNFMKFLDVFYGIKKEKLRFGLQIFNDTKKDGALLFWCRKLNIDNNQFQKVIVTKSRGKGTYKRKIKHGVLTVYFHNKKLREVIEKELKKLGYNNT